MKATAELTASTDTILTRRTQFQDLEAREILLESPDSEGKMFRSTTWITISGPLALTVSLVVPLEHAATIEPFFKATVQSLMFVPDDFVKFETARSFAIKTPASGPINEIQNIVAGLNQLYADREAAINRLTTLFVSHAVTSLSIYYSIGARGAPAAAEALARTKNATLKPLLWHVLDDPDPFVARLLLDVSVRSRLSLRSFSFRSPAQTETIARLWPFMSKDNRIRFLQSVFTQSAPNPKVHMGALTLLGTMTPDEFKFPLARVLAARHDPLTIVALQVANYRGDQLPVESLLKLAASPNEQIKNLAIESYGQSATVEEISQLKR